MDIYSYLEDLVSKSGTELHLEPNKNPYVITSNGQSDVINSPLQGGQISMIVFPMIPDDIKRELPDKQEIEFPFSNKLGHFSVNVKKSPSGFNVTVVPNPSGAVSANSNSKVYIPIGAEEIQDEPVSQPIHSSQMLKQSPENINNQQNNSFEPITERYIPTQTIEKPDSTIDEITESSSDQQSSSNFVNDNSDSISSLNYYLRKMKEKRGIEVNFVANKEVFLKTDNDVIQITSKVLVEAQIFALIDTVTPYESKKQLTENKPTEFVHQNQFGKFVISVNKQSFEGVSVKIKYATASMPEQEIEVIDESDYLSAGSSTATLSFNSNAKLQMDEFFAEMSKIGASDLHLSANMPPIVRKDGRMLVLNKSLPVVSATKMKELLTSIMPRKNQEEFEARHDTDFAYEIPDLARFRANVFLDRKGMGGVFRIIPSKILTAEQLGLSKQILDLCNLSKGLVVVTGPTGSGKSTTLCAMVDHINKEREDHIITIEDPIEFTHENQKCLVNQREVHNHTDSFKDALRAALREDPDILLVGEMRDLETISIAIETAETGHLVFGTLHTTTAASTVDRIIDQFPADRQQQIRVMLSESLKGVIAQTLLPKKGGGRVAALEILIVTPAISNLIREGKTFQIPSAMQTGKQLGMVMLNDALMKLVTDGLVEPRDAYIKCVDKTGFEMALNRAGLKL